MLLGSAPAAPAQPRRGRQLNHALHIIAITRASHDPATKAYLERKEAEGKTTKGALRCLKRHLARRFHHLLSLPAQTPQPDHGAGEEIPEHRRRRDRSSVDTSIAGAAPTPLPCVT